MGKNGKPLKSIAHYDYLGEELDDRAGSEERQKDVRSRQIDFKNGYIGLTGRPFIGDGDDADAD